MLYRNVLPKDVLFFCEVMLGAKTIKTKEEKENFEACYFAMCFLLPQDVFLGKIEMMGGLDAVRTSQRSINILADCFNVPTLLVSLRINDLLSQKEQEQLESKKLTKTIENRL